MINEQDDRAMHQLERRLTRLEPKRGGRMFWIEAPSEAEADRILAENGVRAGDLAIWVRLPDRPAQLLPSRDMENKIPGGRIGKVPLGPDDANL